MSIIVEHEKRKEEILEKALDVFMDLGYDDVTFQKIADRCGITRTTLYIYFKNKNDIFNYSIKHLLSEMEKGIMLVRKDKTLNCTDKLIRVLTLILDKLTENQRLLMVILNYLLYLSKNDTDPDERIRRRTIRLRHIFSSMLIEGIRTGELAEVNVRAADDLLYSLLETAIFRFTILKRPDVEELKSTASLAVSRLRRECGSLIKGGEVADCF